MSFRLLMISSSDTRLRLSRRRTFHITSAFNGPSRTQRVAVVEGGGALVLMVLKISCTWSGGPDAQIADADSEVVKATHFLFLRSGGRGASSPAAT